MRCRRGPATLAVICVLAVGLLSGCATGHSTPADQVASTAADGWSGAIPSTPMRKPDITLIDQDGQRFALKPATRGKVTLLYFGYTHCPDVCPLTMSMLAQAVKALPAATARKIQVVFITTDPARDTPARLRRWLANSTARSWG